MGRNGKMTLVLLTVCVLLSCLTGFTALAGTAETQAPPAQTDETPAGETAADEASAVEAAEEAPAEEEEPYTGIASASSLIAIGALLVLMVIGLMLSAKRIKWNASMIAKAAMCVALAYLLSLIRLYRMPMGGSVKLVCMLPLILFTVAFGPLEGLLIGFVLGLLQLLIDPYVIHPLQLLVDYPMAYGAVALAALAGKFKLNDRLKLPVAVLLGYLGRYLMSVLSGVVFFADYAGSQNALIYSLIYNISYLGPEALLCCVVVLIPGMNRLPAVLRGNSVLGRAA